MNEPKLSIHVEGAVDEEIQRGIAAARKVFDDADGAAVTACCAGWTKVPESADLELRSTDMDDPLQAVGA